MKPISVQSPRIFFFSNGNVLRNRELRTDFQSAGDVRDSDPIRSRETSKTSPLWFQAARNCEGELSGTAHRPRPAPFATCGRIACGRDCGAASSSDDGRLGGSPETVCQENNRNVAICSHRIGDAADDGDHVADSQRRYGHFGSRTDRSRDLRSGSGRHLHLRPPRLQLQGVATGSLRTHLFGRRLRHVLLGPVRLERNR